MKGRNNGKNRQTDGGDRAGRWEMFEAEFSGEAKKGDGNKGMNGWTNELIGQNGPRAVEVPGS